MVTSMDLASASVTAPAPSRAAQYVRMSTEHQLYSPENQLEIIREYAATHSMEIVQDYSDHGRSGLNIACGEYHKIPQGCPPLSMGFHSSLLVQKRP